MRSRLGELPSSDEMEMFYTEHDFQVDLENLRVQLEISCRENTTLLFVDLNRDRSGDNVKILYTQLSSVQHCVIRHFE